MSTRILVMGLSGTGKTTLSEELAVTLADYGIVMWLNADRVREESRDWDFSHQGRIRQSVRLYDLAKSSTADIVVCDFIAPLLESRDIFNADFTVWLDTNKSSQYEDTDSIFIPPKSYDYRIVDFEDQHVTNIIDLLIDVISKKS